MWLSRDCRKKSRNFIVQTKIQVTFQLLNYITNVNKLALSLYNKWLIVFASRWNDNGKTNLIILAHPGLKLKRIFISEWLLIS